MLAVLFIALCLCSVFLPSISSPLRSHTLKVPRIAPRDPVTEPRAVRVVIETTFLLDEHGYPELTYDGIRSFHSYLEIAPDRGVNGGLRIEMQSIPYLSTNYIAVNVVDSAEFGVGWTTGRIAQDTYARGFNLGQTVSFNNAELIDPLTGRGIIASMWAEDSTYSRFDNNGHTLVTRLATK